MVEAPVVVAQMLMAVFQEMDLKVVTVEDRRALMDMEYTTLAKDMMQEMVEHSPVVVLAVTQIFQALSVKAEVAQAVGMLEAAPVGMEAVLVVALRMITPVLAEVQVTLVV